MKGRLLERRMEIPAISDQPWTRRFRSIPLNRVIMSVRFDYFTKLLCVQDNGTSVHGQSLPASHSHPAFQLDIRCSRNTGPGDLAL